MVEMQTNPGSAFMETSETPAFQSLKDMSRAGGVDGKGGIEVELGGEDVEVIRTGMAQLNSLITGLRSGTLRFPN